MAEVDVIKESVSRVTVSPMVSALPASTQNETSGTDTFMMWQSRSVALGAAAAQWSGPVVFVVPSHWRDCHFADALSPSMLHLIKVEGRGGCSRITVSPTDGY